MTIFQREFERDVFKGNHLGVAQGVFSHGNELFVREYLRQKDAVAVVPVIGDKLVVLLHQFRPALNRWIYEIPAGHIEEGEKVPMQVARRELAEETGIYAIESLMSFLVSVDACVGHTNHNVGIWLYHNPDTSWTEIEECWEEQRKPQGPEETAAKLIVVSLSDAVLDIRDGRITDSKTIIGLLIAAARLDISVTL